MIPPFITGLFSVLLIAVAFGVGATLVNLPAHSQSAAAVESRTIEVVIDPATLRAKSALLYDVTSGEVLYQKNGQAQLPLASLTKLMSAQAVLAARPPGTVVRITARDLAPEGDWGLRAGDSVLLADLLKFGLVASSNDAMAAAAASLGGEYLTAMNRTAVSLGLIKTYFLNSTGLDVNDDTAGAYGSAFDVARMTAAFYKSYPTFFELSTHPTVSITAGERTLSAKATTVPLLDIPGFVGGKTGYTDLAGGNLSAIFDLDIGRPVVIVVLQSTEAGRFEDVRTIIESARTAQQQTQ